MPAQLVEAAAEAARLHDLGKAHPAFQDFLSSAVLTSDPTAPGGGPWAKSAGRGRPRHKRPFFRHELASGLALLANPSFLRESLDPDLVIYLIAAHHGRVRLAIRSQPGEKAEDDSSSARLALGIHDGDQLPAVEVPRGQFPMVTLSLAAMELGDAPDGSPSWTSRMIALRDRPDIGPFRLGFLEALVRLADWRASSGEHPDRP